MHGNKQAEIAYHFHLPSLHRERQASSWIWHLLHRHCEHQQSRHSAHLLLRHDHHQRSRRRHRRRHYLSKTPCYSKHRITDRRNLLYLTKIRFLLFVVMLGHIIGSFVSRRQPAWRKSVNCSIQSSLSSGNALHVIEVYLVMYDSMKMIKAYDNLLVVLQKS